MNEVLLRKKFESIGARLKVVARPTRRLRRWMPPDQSPAPLSIDIATDRQGEYFELVPRAGAEFDTEVLQTQPNDRHLLLMVREQVHKSKFLCGHDERHWFVAGIPESAPVGTVRQAKEALQPSEVQHAVARRGLSGAARNKRKNRAFIRQGEWFFLPCRDLAVDESFVLTDEPLVRGNGGKPHWVDFCYRTGGETVYVCGRHPNGVTSKEYKRILSGNRHARRWGWQTMRRNPGVYVRGRVRHADHATITLQTWHQVLMNTENQSLAMRHVAFLD